MFRKIKTDNFYLYSTEIDNLFISDFMIKADGEYVKAYLLALMYAQLGAAASSDSLMQSLGMSRDELDECWEYWEKLGAVKRVNALDGRSYDVEFVNLRELIGAAKAQPQGHRVSDLDDEELRKLYKDVSRATGRMLDRSEMNEIASWMKDYNISPELIVFCYKYCSSKRKSNSYRYVGSVLKAWKEKGIISADAAAEYLDEADSRFSTYKEIFKELGFSRNPTAEEKRLMDQWLDKYIYSLDDILKACRQTIAISNPNLKYVDAVLKNTKGVDPEKTGRENVAVKITAMYEKIRERNEALTEERRRQVFRQIPRVENILREIGSESLAQTQASLRGDRQGMASSEKKIRDLLIEKAQLLKAAGFSENYTDTVYSCSLCKDSGVMEDGSPCSCYAEKLAQLTNGQN